MTDQVSVPKDQPLDQAVVIVALGVALDLGRKHHSAGAGYVRLTGALPGTAATRRDD